MAPFWGQPEGTGSIWCDSALQLAYVGWPHRARCALSHTKLTAVAPIQYVLTGPSNDRYHFPDTDQGHKQRPTGRECLCSSVRLRTSICEFVLRAAHLLSSYARF